MSVVAVAAWWRHVARVCLARLLHSPAFVGRACFRGVGGMVAGNSASRLGASVGPGTLAPWSTNIMDACAEVGRNGPESKQSCGSCAGEYHDMIYGVAEGLSSEAEANIGWRDTSTTVTPKAKAQANQSWR